MICQGLRVDEADLTNEAIEADEANANTAEDVNKVIVVVEAKAKEAIVVDEADVANKANEAYEPDKAVDCNEDGVLDNQLAELENLDVAKGRDQ